jgi:hypothetical protein
VQEALFAVCREAYPRYDLGRFKSPVTLKMEEEESSATLYAPPKLRIYLEPHCTKSQMISLIDTAVATSQKTVFFDST